MASLGGSRHPPLGNENSEPFRKVPDAHHFLRVQRLVQRPGLPGFQREAGVHTRMIPVDAGECRQARGTRALIDQIDHRKGKVFGVGTQCFGAALAGFLYPARFGRAAREFAQ